MGSAEAVLAAIRSGDPEAIDAAHRAVLGGTADALAAADRVYRQMDRLDLAGDLAEAQGELTEAAKLAERAAEWLAAAARWEALGAWTRADAAHARSGAPGATAHCRLLLRLGRPREALLRIGQAATGQDSPLVVLCLLQLGLSEAARARDPSLGDPVIARARLGRALAAEPLSGHLGAVRIEGLEPDGLGFIGTLDGQPVSVRQLDPAALDAALEVYALGLPGVPPLVDSERLVVKRLGVGLDRWSGDAARACRVVERVIDTLARAHARDLFHGALRVDDVRVGAGDTVTVDGWHRFACADTGATRAADPLDLIAPAVQMGAEPDAAADAWSVAALCGWVFEGRPEADFEAIRKWLKGSPALRDRTVEASEAEVGPRYVVRDGATWDTWLDLPVERHPFPADPERLHRLSRTLAGQVILSAGAEVVLAALPATVATTLTADETAAIAHDRALGFTIPPESIRRCRFGVRWAVDHL